MKWRPSGRAYLWLLVANLALWCLLVAAQAAVYAVPLTYDRGVYFADVDIGQRRLRCMVDTGATWSQINAADRTAEWKPVEPQYMLAADGVLTAAWRGPVTVQIGGVTVRNVMVVAHTGNPSDCLIGESVFRAFRYVTLDREHRYLYLGD